MKLQGKTILLTGGTDGIGLRLARQLRGKDGSLIVTGRTPDRIAAAEGEGFAVIPADLASPAGIEAVMTGLNGRAIDVLINNAGMGAAHDYRLGAPDPLDD